MWPISSQTPPQTIQFTSAFPIGCTKVGKRFNLYLICIFPVFFYFLTEEVLGSGSAMWFSPDGKHLAYAEFNDNKLPDFRYFVYGEPGSLDDQYPKEVAIKYPKVLGLPQ